MRLPILLALCLGTRAGCIGAAGEIHPVPSAIHTVTVYLNGAFVERRASFTLPAGESTLLFEGLSSTVNPESIIVKGKGAYTILSVQHKLNYLGEERKSNEFRQLEDSLESLTYTLGQLANRQTVLNEEHSLLQSNKAIGGANSGVTSAELARVAEYMRSRLGKILDELQQATVAEKKMKEQADKVKAQLDVLRSRNSRPSGTITVQVSAPARTDATLELAYAVQQASWYPFYDVRGAGTGPVMLGYRANISQRTGEDWIGVHLILSTGNPSVSGNKPELMPWFLDVYYPVPLLRKEKGMTLDAEASEPAMAAAADARELAESVSVLQNRLTAAFEIAVPCSVPSDGMAHQVSVRNDSVQARYTYACVPKLEKDAFLMADLDGWQGLNLLPGPAYVYFEGSYAGKSYLDPFVTGDTLQFSFGRDPRIVVDRKAVTEYTSSRLIGGNRVKTLSYDVSVRNARTDSVRILVEDQVPVSKVREIEVKSVELSGGMLDPESGRVTWLLNLAPGQSVVRRLTFSVKYPKDKAIGGL